MEKKCGLYTGKDGNSRAHDPVIFGGDPDLYFYTLNNDKEVQQQ